MSREAGKDIGDDGGVGGVCVQRGSKGTESLGSCFICLQPGVQT